MALTVPAGWAKADTAPKVLRNAVKGPLALAPTSRPKAGGLVVGQSAAAAPTFVPASLQRALPPGSFASGDRVRPGKVEAFRYTGLTPAGLDGELLLFVVPQEGGTTVLECFIRRGGARSVLDECAGIVATARIDGSEQISLAPSDRYATAVNAALRALASQRASGLQRLRRATLQAQQAAAADAVSRAYRSAAGRVRKAPVTLLTRAANRELVAALAAADSAYQQLGAAARRDQRARYDAARRGVARAQQRLDRALRALQEVGFFFE